jgi:hypothetical protein
MMLNDEDRQKLTELHTAMLGIRGTADKGFIGETQTMLANHEDRLTKVERRQWKIFGVFAGLAAVAESWFHKT